MTTPEGGWDRPGIIAELHRRGLSLTGLAKSAGAPENLCRKGVIGQSRKGAQIVADALGIKFEELFPGLYLRGPGRPAKANRNTRTGESAKTRASADGRRGAA